MANYLVMCCDLFFTSKVSGTAEMLGFSCESVMSGAKAISTIPELDDLRGIVIDLKTPGLNLEELMAIVPDDVKPHTVAFGPHVDKEEMELALSLGIGAVFPRSKFTADLPAILQQYLSFES